MRTIIRNNYDPHLGDYHERIIQDEAREKTWLFDCDGVYLDITAGRGDVKVVNELGDSETNATSQKLVTDELAKKQDTLTAGDNITIEGNVISAAGKNYSAGYGLTLNDTEFAADTSVLATKTDLAGKQNTLTTAQLAAVNSGIDSGKVAQISTNVSDIDTIEGKIPSAATAQNQLADKSYVDTADNGLQSQIDAISASSDVKDIVGTKAELNSYDTSTLTDKDIICVLNDETHDGNSTYYRYSTATGEFTYIGTTKQYTDFVGTDGTTAGEAGLVPAPATTDAGKVLSASGSWTGLPDGIKTLTTADYNWPTSGTKTSIAPWLLEPGIYKVENANIKLSSSSNEYLQEGATLIIGGANNINQKEVILVVHGGLRGGTYSAQGEYVLANAATSNPGHILTSTETIDNLTNTSRRLPLSARQGKVLNNNIGDLTTLTTTDKTSAVAAINEVNTKAVGTTETVTIATNDWAALSSSDPYDYSATVTATASINASTGVVELLNDQPALFGTYGFAIGAVSGQSVTIYSIGQPDASVSLKLNIRNL